jgi:low temperature requirement protein LtrA
MSANDPQILYMILVVPCLFGLTLVGEGINKLVHNETNGLVSVIFGILFIGLVVYAYLFFSNFMIENVGV